MEEEKRLKKLHNEANGSEALPKAENAENAENGCKQPNGDENDSGTTTSDSVNKTDEKTAVAAAPPSKRLKAFGSFTNAKIETVNENLKEQSLTVQQINEYCKTLFIFKNIRVMRFS